jgi:hypothetical protein
MEITATHAILERLGSTIAEMYDHVTYEPFPPSIAALLHRSRTQTQETNILCALVGTLAHADFAFEERGGELFLVSIKAD